MKYWFVLLILALECLTQVNTLQCYKCTSDAKSACGDPFEKNSMTDADKSTANPGFVCVKSVTKQSGKPTDIVRGSTMPVPLLVCSKGSNACSDITIGDATTTTCCCDSDLCNHAQTVQQQSRLVYGIFAVVAMSVYRIFH